MFAAAAQSGSVPEWLGVIGSVFGVVACVAIPTVRSSANRRMANNEAALIAAAENVLQLEEGRKLDRENHERKIAEIEEARRLDAEQCAKDIGAAHGLAQQALDEVQAARSEMVKAVAAAAADAATKASIAVFRDVGARATAQLGAGQQALMSKLDEIHAEVVGQKEKP